MALEPLFNEWEDTIINPPSDIRQDVTQLQDGIQMSTRKLCLILPVVRLPGRTDRHTTDRVSTPFTLFNSLYERSGLLHKV